MKRTLLSLVLLLAIVLFAWPASAEDYTWDAASATQITLSGNSITVEGSGATVDSSTVIITQAGTYVLSGTLDDGQVVIAATKDDTVRLVLNGVTLSSSTSAPIYASKTDKLILILADGTTNTISDATDYVYAEGVDEPDAAIFAKDDLRIGGNGTLVVTGNYRNGIGTKDDLVIDGGTITVTAVNDALRGRDSVTVNAGSLTLTAGNDGIKSNNDEDAAKGWVEINGGTIDITAAFDGIQAETAMTINDGTINIVAGGGSASAPARSGGKSGGFGGRGQAATTTTTETSESMKGLKASTALTLNGGTLTIDTQDDALHTNGDLTINGGTMTLSTGDDGAHADDALLITGGTIRILTSYEGLEGTTVEITGGDIDLTATDDGINAAGGSDGNTEGGGFGRDMFSSNSNIWLNISGGTLVARALQGDGLDSNGTITISGGDVTVHGPSSDPESGLDANGTILVTGGNLMVGSSVGNGERPDTSSSQPSVGIYFSSVQPAGTVVTLTDSNGNVLATYTAEYSVSMVLFSSPSLRLNEAYNISINGAAPVSFTVTSGMTAINETGAETSVGGRGGMGGGGGRGNWPSDGQSQMPGRQMPEGGTMPDGQTPDGQMSGEPPAQL